ncbi:S1 RNA-binding domain-containing protein [Chloroflexota bacterium]
MNEKKIKDEEQLDESWWAAVMADEEIIADIDEVGEPGSVRLPQEADRGRGTNNDWPYVNDLKQQDQVVECETTEFNQGGLLVAHEQFEGFVPISHLVNVEVLEDEANREKLLKSYLGKQMSLKVIECDESRGRIVLSERAALAAPGERQRLFETLEANNSVSGTVTNITEFGVFVDLGGVEGLAHISELSWGRVGHPKDLFEIGQELEVLILQVDQRKGRVSLSIKRLLSNPWDSVEELYPSGQPFSVTVTKIVKYGAFVRLEDGLEGLIHITEMHLVDDDRPEDILQPGEQILVEVIMADSQRQRLSLRLVE